MSFSFRIPFIAAMLACTFATAAHAHDFLDRVQDASEAGAISADAAYQSLFRYAFDRDAVSPELLGQSTAPLKCLQDVIAQYQKDRDTLSPATTAEIEGYLDVVLYFGKTAATYVSPSGTFEFTYSTSGGNAVPSADVNPANGVPDYVEKCAIYADSSWTRQITEVGFDAPSLTGGVYPMSFQNMGAYGFAVSTGGGSSYIVIENDFAGFPNNSDPEGNQLGAAKATIAHEFKHASQFATGSYGGWAEMDATWSEDIVFDLTDDYYNYLGSGNNMTAPSTPLDQGGGASYEDCIWGHFLSESFGLPFMVDHAARLSTQTITVAYRDEFLDNATTWADEFTNYATWNYLVGSHANTSLPGYEEAGDFPIVFPTFEANLVYANYPYANNNSLDNMAMRFYKLRGLSNFAGNIRIEFDGANNNRPLDVVLVSKVKDAFGGGWEREDIPLDANVDGDYTAIRPGAQLAQAGVIVVYPARTSGGASSYDITISENVATDVTDGLVSTRIFGLEPNAPNPFNPTTTIAFALPHAMSAELAIYSPAGRLVRTLVANQRLEAGRNTFQWDGNDDAGHPAGSGVYHARLVAGKLRDTKQMILIR